MSSCRGQEVMLNEAFNVVDARATRGRRDRHGQGRDRGRTARSWSAGPTRSASSSWPARSEGEAPGGRRPDARPPLGVRLRGDPAGGGRGARPRGGPGHRLQRHRRPRRADRADPGRRRAALPAPGAVPGARAQAAEGGPALRPSRVRQDAHRQGRRELAGRDGRRRAAPRSPRAPSSTSRVRSCSTSTSARRSGTSG